jgi:type IV pilus biogenesis protein CpaD/CtpE
MKLALAFILLCLLTGCATKPNEALPDPTQTKADVKAREEFARNLPKPAER